MTTTEAGTLHRPLSIEEFLRDDGSRENEPLGVGRGHSRHGPQRVTHVLRPGDTAPVDGADSSDAPAWTYAEPEGDGSSVTLRVDGHQTVLTAQEIAAAL